MNIGNLLSPEGGYAARKESAMKIGNLPSVVLPSGTEVSGFTLLQWKHAIRLESKGLRHSSGRSVRKHAALHLGMRPMAKADDVVGRIEELLS